MKKNGMTEPGFKTGTVKKNDVDADEISFAIDSALSWEGNFPKVGPGDYVVTVQTREGEDVVVLASRRYTGFIGPSDAAQTALEAVAERREIAPDDCFVSNVDKVVA